jgi:hypothetical protein
MQITQINRWIRDADFADRDDPRALVRESDPRLSVSRTCKGDLRDPRLVPYYEIRVIRVSSPIMRSA